MEENESDQKVEFKYKQMIVVRTDLGMSKGKAMTQACHVAVKASIMALNADPETYNAWDDEGYKKVTCKASSLDELKRLETASIDAGLPHYLVADRGYTELPAGTITALAIGPALNERIDPITANLKLL